MCLLVYIYIWHFILFWDRAVKINAKIVLKNFPDKSSFWQRRWTFFDLIFFLYYLRTSFFPLNLSLPLTVESWELFLLWLESLFTVLHFLRQLRFLQHMPCKICSWNKTKITSVFYIMNEVLGFIIPFKWWKIT